MSLKNKVAIGILAICGLFGYIYLVNKWNRELDLCAVCGEAHSHSHAPDPSHSVNESAKMETAKKEIELSYLENRDSILSVTKYPILIYRYSQNYCTSCITEDLSELNILQNEVAKGKIVVLPAYEENQRNRIAFANQLANFEYKNVPASLLILPKNEDGFAQRYFALIDNKGNLGEVLFPERVNTAATKAYFQRVKGYFNSVRE